MPESLNVRDSTTSHPLVTALPIENNVAISETVLLHIDFSFISILPRSVLTVVVRFHYQKISLVKRDISF
jgi:hypothetical protein